MVHLFALLNTCLSFQNNANHNLNYLDIVNDNKYDIKSETLIQNLQNDLAQNSAVTLPSFLKPSVLQKLVDESIANEDKAYYAGTSYHTIFMKPIDHNLHSNHICNRQVLTSKGCITTDLIPNISLLKVLYYDETFQQFLIKILGINNKDDNNSNGNLLYDYDDPLSSLTVHYAKDGQELGWHFDNSAFAITLLLQKADEGGVFEFMPNIRQVNAQNNNDDSFKDCIKPELANVVEDVLDGKVLPKSLELNPGTLVLFRGRDSMHRVSKVIGDTIRILVVFAYNEVPGVRLDEERMMKHFGRIA